jgi:tRNA C32,U32 (ribose-2'-O)-methylase TrmJ
VSASDGVSDDNGGGDDDSKARGLYAIVFGNEADGLNTGELQACQAYVTIPTRGTLCNAM